MLKVGIDPSSITCLGSPVYFLFFLTLLLPDLGSFFKDLSLVNAPATGLETDNS